MMADLLYVLPDCLYFEGLIAASESINCVSNTQTGPTRTAVEMVTGQRPYVRPFRFGQPGLCHVRRPDSSDIRAELCIFLTQNLVSTGSFRVYLPHNRSIVLRKKFRATEGYPDLWKYERRPRILPIPCEERKSERTGNDGARKREGGRA